MRSAACGEEGLSSKAHRDGGNAVQDLQIQILQIISKDRENYPYACRLPLEGVSYPCLFSR